MTMNISVLVLISLQCLCIIHNTQANFLSMLIYSSRDYHAAQYHKLGSRFSFQDSSPSIRIRRNTEIPAEKPVVKYLAINSEISARFAQTTMASEIVNPGAENRDAYFTVQIPETAFISNFTMIINGEFYQANVKEKGEAKREYEEAKDKNKTAGLVSNERENQQEIQRGMEVFSVSITIKGNTSAQFELSYQELLVRTLGAYEQRISIRPNQIVEHLTAHILLHEPQGFSSFDVFEPSLDTNSITNVYTKITEVGNTSKTVYYEPDMEGQEQFSSDHGVSGDLVVVYDVNHPYEAGLTQYQDSYFVHYFSPDESRFIVLGKSVIFVIDISGSMDGEKIKQTREAMLIILDQLHSDDKFMLLLFDDNLEYWPSHGQELVAVNENNIQSAKEFVRTNVIAAGGTNINLAVVTASQILAKIGKVGANMMIFLTDGEPTVGETNSDMIVSNVVAKTEKGQVAIFSLAFGYSLDYKLLETMSYMTQGLVKRIHLGKDVAEQLQNFYNEISSPLLTNLKLIFPSEVVNTVDLTRNEFYQYFKGTEVIVAGKIEPTAPREWDIEITADDFFMEKSIDTSVMINIPDENILEKLYTYMMIKDLLRQVYLTVNVQEKEAIEARALSLALEYNLVTPLTSMVIVQTDRSNDYDMMEAAFVPGGRNVQHNVVRYAGGTSNLKSQNSKLITLLCSLYICFSYVWH